MGRKNKASLWLEYFLTWLGKNIFFVLSWRWAQRGGFLLGWLVRHFLPGRRKIVTDNLKYAFPEKKEQERIQIAKKVWDNIGITAAEFIKMQQLAHGNLLHYIKIQGEEYLKESLATGKGGILFSAHFCNWEIVHAALSLKGYPILAIARPLENPLVDRFVNLIRESFGTKIISAKNSIGQALNWLRTNRLLYVLLDQRITEGDIYVNFLNRPAATSPIVALLARRTGTAVIPIYSVRKEDGIIEIYVEEPLKIKMVNNIRENTLLNTVIFSRIIEGWIEKYPHYWFWVHNRWKRG
ncbi:MAG TPA: hypothetical protein DHV62_03800 [Elusimicrobia bacterium]|nr:hypothetical protein [Elusimicrobiota bacterium]